MYTAIALILSMWFTTPDKIEGILNRGNVMLFPYKVVQGSDAKLGLFEDFKGQRLTKATAYLMPRGTRYVVLDTLTVEYHRESIVKPIELKVVHIKVRSRQLTDLKGRPIPFSDLKGFVLATRLK